MISLDELNARHGTDFRLAGRYEGGEVGAIRLVDAQGRAFVLKEQAPGLAPQATEVLRPLGYPTPQYVVWGEDYHVSEELPGSPASMDWGPPNPELTARLLELNELQDGRGVDADESWPDAVVESVTTGFSDYAVVGTLEGHSDDTRELLELCRKTAERYGESLRGARDIVHWDYTLANVLVQDDRITGVIDWAGTRTGDRLFDLATLAYYAKGEAPELERHVVDRIGREGLAVYLAHLCVRQSDWSLRHHEPAAAEEAVAYSLDVARAFP